MQSIKEQLSLFSLEKKEGGARNMREDSLELILEELNSARRGTKYKELTYSAIIGQMARIGLKSKEDYRWMYDQCRRSRNFSSTFWWYIKEYSKK